MLSGKDAQIKNTGVLLWATHLIDEVMQEDHIVVLHHRTGSHARYSRTYHRTETPSWTIRRTWPRIPALDLMSRPTVGSSSSSSRGYAGARGRFPLAASARPRGCAPCHSCVPTGRRGWARH